MNKFELDKIMEYFGTDKKECYEFYGCKYYHDGRYFTIVKGKTPYELAKLISEKYDNKKFKIRVEGNHENHKPTGNVYTYHIDTIEGLVAFLIETKNYYFKIKNNFDEFENALDIIYKKILENLEPQISIYDWMLDRNNKKEYFEQLLDVNTYFDFKIRRQIKIFDSIINPFVNNYYDISDNNFIVHGDRYQEDEIWFTLTDKKSGVVFSNLRNKDGFILKLYIPIEEPYEIVIYHYFDKNGEEIVFERYDELGLSRVEYNLTNKSFCDKYAGDKHQVTIKDKNFIIKSLEKYIIFAKDIVDKNLGTKFNDVKSELKKVKRKK